MDVLLDTRMELKNTCQLLNNLACTACKLIDATDDGVMQGTFGLFLNVLSDKYEELQDIERRFNEAIWEQEGFILE